MSPRWRTSLRVALCPDRLVAVRYARGLRSRVEDRRIVSLSYEREAEVPAEVRAEAQTKVLPQLKELLAEALNRAADTTLVLGSHFARYALLPFNPALTRREEWEAYARHAFASTYGSAATRWQIRVFATGRDQPRLACGVDAALLEAIANIEAETGARVVSIQPYLMAAFNRCCGAIDNQATWIALAEADRMTVGFIAHGAWKLLRQRQGGLARLDTLIEREIALGEGESDCERVLVVAEEAPAARAGRFHLTDATLPAGAALELRPCSMALA